MLSSHHPEATMKLSHNRPSLNPFPCPSFPPTRPSWPRCGTLMTWQRKPTHRLMLTIRELHSDYHLHAQRTMAIQQESGRQHRASDRSTITAMPNAPQGTKPPSRQWQQTVSKQRQATAKQTQHSKYLRLQHGWRHIQSVGMQGRLYRSIQHDRELDSSTSKHNMPAMAYQP